MSSALRNYLAQIRDGSPINYTAFLKQLPPDIAARHREYFDLERVSEQRWRVLCNDPKILARLEESAVVPDSRRLAALQGDSHRQQTGAAFVLVYHETLADWRPDVVFLTPDARHISFEAKPTALVIENEENFAQFRQMLSFASDCLGESFSLASCDVILGGGNRVSRSLVSDWLAGYERVLCAFDYDLGGLKMYDGLRTRLGSRALFVQPEDWSRLSPGFRLSPRTSERLVEAISRANDLGFSGLADMFRQTQKFMEQESLLGEEPLDRGSFE